MAHSRKPVIAGNWKMNKTHLEADQFVAALPESLHTEHDVEMILCAPATALTTLAAALKDSTVTVGAQNVHPEPSGAYTGELSTDMLKAAGCDYVVLGHSERREYFHEDNALINAKVKAVIAAGLRPILCIGESLEEREAGTFEEKLLRQLEEGLADVDVAAQREKILVAYEPIWAIGTGKTCDEQEANRILKLLRDKLSARYGDAAAQSIRLLYGGSVKPATIQAQIQQSDLDGALVGGASLQPESFAQLVQLCKEYGT